MQIGQHLVFFYSESAEIWELLRLVVHHSVWGNLCFVADQSLLREARSKLDAQGIRWLGRYHDVENMGFYANPIRINQIKRSLTETIEAILIDDVPLTLFVDMTWVIRSPSGIVYLREYEAAMAILCEQYQLNVVCLYNRHIMPDQVLLNGLHTHQMLLTLNGSQPNPHYVPPEIYKQRKLKPQIDYWLGRLIPKLGENPSLPQNNSGPEYTVESLPHLTATDAPEKRWKIRLFGHMRVYREQGDLIEWNVVSGATKKSRALFAYLLFKGEAGASAEEIAELLWPESDDFDKSLNRLYHTVRCVRKALSPRLKESRKSPFLISENHHYFLALPENSWIDMPLFQEQCYRGESLAKAGRLDEALVVYRSAERLYTGDLLADIPLRYTDNQENDWCWSRRYWFREMYFKMMVNAARLLRQTGQVGDGLRYVNKVLKLDPISEPANLEKMHLLQAAGRKDAVLRQYRLYRDALDKRNMGEPGPEVMQLLL